MLVFHPLSFVVLIPLYTFPNPKIIASLSLKRAKNLKGAALSVSKRLRWTITHSMILASARAAAGTLLLRPVRFQFYRCSSARPAYPAFLLGSCLPRLLYARVARRAHIVSWHFWVFDPIFLYQCAEKHHRHLYMFLFPNNTIAEYIELLLAMCLEDFLWCDFQYTHKFRLDWLHRQVALWRHIFHLSSFVSMI